MGRLLNITTVGVALLAAPGELSARAPAGGVCAWRSGEILETSGEVQTGGLRGRVERRVEIGSGRLAETNDLGIIITRHGFDGRVAWNQDMSGGVHDLNSTFARKLAISMAWLDGHAGCIASAPLTRTGNHLEHGRRFTAWRAAPPNGTPFELWTDARTKRLDRAFFQMTESRLIRHFADWRNIGGGRFVAFQQRDEFPEDEDETSVRLARASVHHAAARKDFDRPQPPDDAAILHGQSTTIGYEDDHRTRIYVPVYLNGKGPFLFELDNGGHNILATETAQAIGLTPAGSFNSTGAGTAVTQSGIARVQRIQIGDAVMTDQPVKIRKFSPSSNDRSPNPPRAGVLGLELFERFVVAIDAAHKTITLSRFGATSRPAGTAAPLVFAEDAPLVAGSYLGRKGDFMLDTGNAGPTIIEDYWARPLGVVANLGQGLKRGDTWISKGTVGLGPTELGDELVSYYGPAERGSEYSRAVAGVYGEPLLSRFNATYDYSRYTVWLDPLPAVGPLPFDRSGVSLAKNDTGSFKVAGVTPGSPADQAGVRAGDLLKTVDGVPAVKLSRADAAAILRREPGTRIRFSGTFSGLDGSKELMLRELVH